MRLLLLLIGCLLASSANGSPRRVSHEIIDMHGNCWICDSLDPCRPCSSMRGPPTPTQANFDPTCPTPVCSATNVHLFFPVSNDPTKFWQCVSTIEGGMEPLAMDCQCGTYFYWDKQRCEFPWDVPQLCNEVIEMDRVPPPRSCDGVTGPIIPPFNPACPVPACTGSDLELLFPYNDDPRKFIQCGSVNNSVAPVVLNCQCGTYFNFVNQRCDFPFEVKE